MNMHQVIRVWFLVLYSANIFGFLSNVIRIRRHVSELEDKVGPVPSPGAVVAYFVPLILLITTVGEVPAERPVIRLFGVLLSVYSLVMVAWTVRTMRRLLVPGLGVFPDHTLLTGGPFRLVRHPLYSGVLSLWLGAGLGTLNWVLLVLWPLPLIAVWKELHSEEGILKRKFGSAYEEYAERTGRLMPWL